METRTKVFIAFFVLIVLVVGLYNFTSWFSDFTGYSPLEYDMVSFAQCLSGKGFVFYVTTTCVSCDVQSEMFGEEAYSYVNVKNCDRSVECPRFKDMPAWSDGERTYYGFATIGDLSRFSGCEIERI